jgi:glycosyltransferase involved in cell wall biosynthesis
MTTNIVILLATFNGDEFLVDQLNSIESQSLDSWRMFVSDDGSSDRTPAIVADFQSRHPDRVTVMMGPPSGSPKANFERLLRHAPEGDYYLLCDQDDVWRTDKLQLLTEACATLDDARTPCLVYSDLRVVDAALATINESFLDEIAADPARVTFGSLLVENSIPGCSMLFNKALLDRFRSHTGSLDDAQMHDWWLALIAFSLGKVQFVPEKLVLYRQHSHNSAGSVRRRGWRFYYRKLFSADSNAPGAAVRQANSFLKAYGRSLERRNLDQLVAFSNIESANKISRIAICLRHGILKQSALRRLYQLIRI